MALQPGPWSDDVARGPEAQRRAQVGARFFGFFFMVRHSDDWKKKLARKARDKTLSTRGNEENHSMPANRKRTSSTPNKAPPTRRKKTYTLCIASSFAGAAG
ncbi:hypothetical protein GCM10017655_43580 [Pseudomonas turukhanskensis]|uniref:Uncharacterized protein n=1 Tax=Pseudomonas turukhanskensis TaxID=1806536 RepID=A0A9W6KC44_9PSED|nr:hypothetical protein GCM10017655_43580 [Pseudomonas turukhanskensis]